MFDKYFLHFQSLLLEAQIIISDLFIIYYHVLVLSATSNICIHYQDFGDLFIV